MNSKEASANKAAPSSLLNEDKEQQQNDSDFNLFICENTDGILDPLEQMTYALNETQIRYGPVVVLKNAP